MLKKILILTFLSSASTGPSIARTTGRRIRPWKRPKRQIMKKIWNKDKNIKNRKKRVGNIKENNKMETLKAKEIMQKIRNFIINI